MSGLRIASELPDSQRIRAAEIYYRAFEGKIGAIMKRDGTAEKFLAEIMKPEFAVFAFDADEPTVLGVAGFKTEQGAFTQGKFSDMMWHYGIFGTFWRATLLSFLERSVKPGELQMDGIAVAEEARGQGVGTALLNAAFEAARERGLKAVSLDVIDTNPRAQALYERMGFKVVSEESTGLLRRVFGFEKSRKMVKKLENEPGLGD